MAVDPTIMLAQLAQGERLVHEIQIGPIIAQAADHEVAARQLLEDQQRLQGTEKSEEAEAANRKTEGAVRRRQGRGRRRQQQRHRAQAQPRTPTFLPAAASDAQTDEVAGSLVDASV